MLSAPRRVFGSARHIFLLSPAAQAIRVKRIFQVESEPAW
jgi:hypothetical protein